MYETNNFYFKLPDGNIIKNPLTSLIENLDHMPYPDRDLIYEKASFLARNPIKVFLAGRGCPFKCSYCFNHAYQVMYKGKGRMVRQKSVSYLLSEIKYVRNKYPLTFIKFHDDVFGINKEWLNEFAERYPSEVGLPFLCYSRPTMVDEEYCMLLKRAGCYSVSMAIECGNEKIRSIILNRKMSDAQILNAAEFLYKSEIKVHALNMIGLPGETEKDIMRTVDLNSNASPNLAETSIFQPYPGTKIAEYCKRIGILNTEKIDFQGQYSGKPILNFSKEFKTKIIITHRLFTMIVDYPYLKNIINLLSRLHRRYSYLLPILDLIYRLYHGYNLHRRIYNNKIPFYLRMQKAVYFLFSKNYRT